MRLSSSLTAVVAAAASLVNAAPANEIEKRRVAYNWGTTKVRGVNIGGWLVLEPFITPSIFTKYSTSTFTPVDEWTLCQKLGKQGCYNALKPHWDSFVKLSDFQKIKNAGFNVIRIPIGYWAYLDAGGPYTFGAAPYLDKAIGWARQVDLKVIIDLHGAPKSQNGFDHSGHKLPSPQWGQGDSIPQTHKVLKMMEDKYAIKSMQDVVIAIEVLNEPFLSMLDSNMVKQFYRDSYYNLRKISDTPLMIHDGFWDPAWLNGFLTPSDNNAQFVIVDHHEYQIFDSNLVAMSPTQHRTQVCNSVNGYANSDKWTMVGEWSGAMTDCAPHLNGFKSGNRYEGTWSGSWRIGSCAGKSGKVNTWSQAWKDDVRRYIETQLDAFEAKTDGWTFWNFKTEGSAGEWDLFQLLDNGVFPQPLNNRKFGKYCKNF
ncbi:glycoside hydrolase family 5 protein [Trematosphaeria pertusa]|uniref:Glycoside hydrolase family 5 protein n=1 Tax=Trematosphaeria pertusa TaxID=390896 RepID=A0A6A6I1G7_9PLEO|nr:glycoside hydrolase family 5 protein [Trematosphaeria pertusa]KAF2243713.1 glycoside hydrolase family 5 protein [Trematosphaeria pertusa]